LHVTENVESSDVVLVGNTQEGNTMLRFAAVVFITLSAATAGKAADVKVLAALAVQDALDAIGASFSRDSGHTAQIAYSTVGAIRKRLAAGERADVVILTADAINEMARKERLSDSAPVAATRTGVAVRDGATPPDIGTVDQFRAALLAARSVAYTDPKSGGAFGTYFAGELQRMGIADAVNAKAVLRTGSHEIVKSVASGEAELGVTFISVIVSTKGVKVAGPLPPPLVGTEGFSAGILRDGITPDAARAFMSALRDPKSGAMWAAAGFEVVNAKH
jgi:molybdate transport system substrate-binding protein